MNQQIKIIYLLMLVGFYTFFSNRVCAQNSFRDSLYEVLSNAKENTDKVDLLNYMSSNLGWRLGDYDTALYFANSAKSLAEKLNYNKGIGVSYNNLGMTYREQGRLTEALENHFISLGIRKQINDMQGIAYSYNNIGLVYEDQG